jgi:hypothetical protein
MKPNEVPQSIGFAVLSLAILACAGCDTLREYGGRAEGKDDAATFTVRYAPKEDRKIRFLDTNNKEIRPCKLCDAKQGERLGGSSCPKAKESDRICPGFVNATMQDQTALIFSTTTHSPISCRLACDPATGDCVELGCWCFKREAATYPGRCTWFYDR